ncbi:MAG: hypothetical protein NT093_02515 [Candidatus Moranbacteria bacterium]|nr:hypothetical protein [Candidatus Moranbacteria bacterium]
MGSTGRYNRVVMRVASEDVGAVKKNLEKSGIIYAEEDGAVFFSVLPAQRREDFFRVKEIFLGASARS